MPVLKNPKWERFAQELAKGRSQVEAYERAGYKPDSGAANRLSGNVSIQARVAELQNKVAERTEITLQSLLEDAERIQRGAERDGQWTAANAALQSKAKLAGKWIDRHEHGAAGAFEALSDAELLVQIERDSLELGMVIPRGETAH